MAQSYQDAVGRYGKIDYSLHVYTPTRSTFSQQYKQEEVWTLDTSPWRRDPLSFREGEEPNTETLDAGCSCGLHVYRFREFFR